MENISSYFDNCRLSVAPIRYGAGIKGKIGTSASYGVPCVATSVAAEGMGLTDNLNVLIADNPQQFAEKVIDLYSDENLWLTISVNSLDFMYRNYSYESGKEIIKDLCKTLLAPSIKAQLKVVDIAGWSEYLRYKSKRESEYARRIALEKSYIGNLEGFALDGYCAVCMKSTTFHVDSQYAFSDAEGNLYPNWRERLVCRYCELNNRTRASIHLFQQECHPPKNAQIYITEQTTPLFSWISHNYSSVIGSEFLNAHLQSGFISSTGIRHESLANLSFPDESFDFILSFDVFEHIPDYKIAISECFRVLKDGGKMIFSVPFHFESEDNIVLAKVLSNGSVDYLMEPEYHGDPLNSNGCLCFYHFGWNLLSEFQEVGFQSAKAYFYWSDKLGYLGVDQVLFIANKS